MSMVRWLSTMLILLNRCNELLFLLLLNTHRGREVLLTLCVLLFTRSVMDASVCLFILHTALRQVLKNGTRSVKVLSTEKSLLIQFFPLLPFILMKSFSFLVRNFCSINHVVLFFHDQILVYVFYLYVCDGLDSTYVTLRVIVCHVVCIGRVFFSFLFYCSS